MTDEETAQVNVKVPKRTKERAKKQLDHGGITRLVKEQLQRVAHGEKVTEIERTKDHLEDLRDERRDLKNERQDIENKLEDLEVKIERAENRLDDLRDRQGEYEGALRMISDTMQEEGMRVDPGHGMIQSAAEAGDCTPEDVVDDLKDRNPDLSDDMFCYEEPPVSRGGIEQI